MLSSIKDRTQMLINSIHVQFLNRTQIEGRKKNLDYGIRLHMNVTDDFNLWLKFSRGDENHTINIPLPFVYNGVQFIQQNEVTRATCPFWLESEQRELDYLAIMHMIIFDHPVGILPKTMLKATCFLQQMVYGFLNGNASVIAYRFQQAVNEVVHRMPLHETMLNSYIMNQRLMIVDEAFNELRSPEQRLKYQTQKAMKYFDRGWTAVGLSDGTLADKNYILKQDLRHLSPYGVCWHNPQRNLYSTLGMKGEELPNIRSESMQKLVDAGISRTGWNLFTAFVDIPDVFEDQIMVDEDLIKKHVSYSRRYQVFGKLLVKEGDRIRTGDRIGISPDGEAKLFDVICEKARIKKVAEAKANIGGQETVVYNVMIEYVRFFKEGFKITNMHGNKGVIRITKLGYAIDPRTGEKRKIDVIVGAKTVGKRRNYGQIIEAIHNCVLEADGHKEHIVIPDDWFQTVESIGEGLERRGFRKDGTWDCDTYAGKVKAVCGNVFWGVIKTPEDQLWDDDETLRQNGKEIRTAGLKFSHVEFRALETRFGSQNAILDEIMSYVQGSENLSEMFKMMRSMRGEVPGDCHILHFSKVRPLDQTSGTIVEKREIAGTIADDQFMPGGFVLELPLPYQTLLNKDYGIEHEGYPMDLAGLPEDRKELFVHNYITQMLYVPQGALRKCWRHDSGKYGLNEMGVLFNNVLLMSHKLAANPQEDVYVRLYYKAVFNLFRKLSLMMGTKNGELATCGMAVRYPFSAKAVATLSNALPKNTVEIHRSMAQQLGIKNGDVVLSERFPCLGFMSLRPQKVRVTDDPMCKYVIRVSGNSLVSQNLDFDGDVSYIAAMHTPAAKLTLLREWTNPNPTCYKEIKRLNERKGAPHVKEFTLQDFNIVPFGRMSCTEHAEIVEKNTGVKAQTGPVIALTYNLMRIVENSDMANNQKMKVAVEMFLERAAQSVFDQKHGGRSMYDIVIEGVCTANIEMLVGVGFKRSTTTLICDLIRKNAVEMGIHDLVKYHANMKKLGGGNIISKIVRKKNKIYFASRSALHPVQYLDIINEPAVDVPSRMFKWVMSGRSKTIRTALDMVLEEKEFAKRGGEGDQEAIREMVALVDDMLRPNTFSTISFVGLRSYLYSGRRGHVVSTSYR